MSAKVTIYEVATAAQVSISTVSNVINKPERVGAATRERVLRVADELGFMPKHQAVNQATRGTGRIGVLAPFTSYSSFMRRLAGVLAEVNGHPIDVSVFDIESAAEAASPLLGSIPLRGRVDGIIVMGESISEPTERRLQERGLPVVVVDATSDLFSVVAMDDGLGGQMAAKHMLELGHINFAYLQERQESEYMSQARKRLDGFAHELRKQPGTQLRVIHTDGSLEGARAATYELLSGAGRPTAIMAHYDDIAVGALLAARQLGLRVPEDLSVMGFDDGPIAQASDLTTVHQPFEESGSVAVRILLSNLENPGPRTVTFLGCKLIERSTTGPLTQQ